MTWIVYTAKMKVQLLYVNQSGCERWRRGSVVQLTRSGGKMAKKQHQNDHREFLLQQKVLFADVDAFELEEDDSSTSKESEEMSPTLPPSDKEEEGS